MSCGPGCKLATARYQVACDICGHLWDEVDPGVTFHHDDHVWTCRDESPCFDRKAMNELERST